MPWSVTVVTQRLSGTLLLVAFAWSFTASNYGAADAAPTIYRLPGGVAPADDPFIAASRRLLGRIEGKRIARS